METILPLDLGDRVDEEGAADLLALATGMTDHMMMTTAGVPLPLGCPLPQVGVGDQPPLP